MLRNAFGVVEEFERRVAEFAGSEHAVAVDSCTIALFLCCKLKMVGRTFIPARTYLSVPMSIIHAGGTPVFEDIEWQGVYELKPHRIYDGAKRFRRGMYMGGLHCLSFHIKKHIPIGRGGMILTDDSKAVEWLKKARYDGRSGVPYPSERVSELGWNCYLTPEQAARGLLLLDVFNDELDSADQIENYPDLRVHPIFAQELQHQSV